MAPWFPEQSLLLWLPLAMGCKRELLPLSWTTHLIIGYQDPAHIVNQPVYTSLLPTPDGTDCSDCFHTSFQKAINAEPKHGIGHT